MVVKLSAPRLSRRIPTRVSLCAFLATVSCANSIQRTQKPSENQLNSNAFEAKIQYLNHKLHPDSLISLLERSPDLDSSVKLFKWASLQKGFRHTADTYRSMIHKLGMAGHAEMEEFCQEMVKEKFPGFGESLSILIEAFIKNNRLNESMRILYVMNLSSCKPSPEVINALMGALVLEKRDFKDVLFVYKEMVKAEVTPNIGTLNFLLEALFEAERVDTAVDQYIRINKKGCYPDSRTFEIVITSLAERDRVEESVAILNEMFQLGIEPDSHFYHRVVPLFCGLKYLEVGMRLVKMMRTSKILPHLVTYKAMIKCLCDYLYMDDAIKLYEEMVDYNLLPDHEMHLDIIKGFCNLTKLEEAKEFLFEKNVTDARIHNVVLKSYCDNKSFFVAKHVFDAMFQKNVTDVKSWNIIIRFLCEKKLINKALEYLSRMVIFSFDPDVATYSAIIIGNCNIQNFEDALKLFRHVRFKCWVLDSLAYARLIEILCQRATVREASLVFCYMSSKCCPLQSTSFSMLIEKICVNGKVHLAIRLLSMAHDSGMSASVGSYNCILHHLLKPCQKNLLEMIVSRMIVVGCNFNRQTYCILIQSMVALNQVGNITWLLNLMFSEGLVPDSETFLCALSCLVSYFQVHVIYPIIKKIISEHGIFDAIIFNLLIDGLWREGWKVEARHILDLMLEKGWVPNSSTHALLMGNAIAGKETLSQETANKDIFIPDNISSILGTDLGKT